MKIVKPSASVFDPTHLARVAKDIERAARVCYKSESKIGEGSAEKLVGNLIANGHEAMLEHVSFSVLFICDRGISHEIVRHRIASYAQESTRYCNYSQEKFGNEITVIEPSFFEPKTWDYSVWKASCEMSEAAYFELLRRGRTPQEARSVLPNSLKTELIMTANLREWRHFLKLRTALTAHPQMREITIPLLEELKSLIPVVFDDILPDG